MLNFPPTDVALATFLERVQAGSCEMWSQNLDLDRSWAERPSVDSVTVTYRAERSTDNRLQVFAGLGLAETADAFGKLIHVSLTDPVRLAPVTIAKPWGEEIWFTGIEARGESSVVGTGGQLPLSVYLATAPDRLCGRTPPTLLKILAPSAQDVLGDLYFEVHDTKQEVYVVTGVDKTAWPSGTGKIRFGMNQALRQQMGDERFRDAYLNAVKHYETIRRTIDSHDADAAGTLDAAELQSLETEEAEARAAMHAFTQTADLVPGDVVVVPIWLPHSLQHGVRVVEFQTPTFERHILSFAQKVQTQDHWDTDRVINDIRLDCPTLAVLQPVSPGVERIVQFEDFGAWRVRLQPDESANLPTDIPYAIVMGVEGTATIGDLTLAPEQAAFVPGTAISRGSTIRNHHTIHNTDHNKTTDTATILVAAPNL